MKSMRLRRDAKGVDLVEEEGPRPQPGPGELLIRVFAAGVTPSELVWYPTSFTKSGEPRDHVVPGHEFSGVVAAVGDGVTDVEIGQTVYGMNDWFADGATAEYCVTVPSFVAPKPARMSHAEAATIPIGALTAWQGLFDRAGLKEGERVLVQGGAGAVGVFAVQLARIRGARVVSTASPHNAEFVRHLGSEEVVDYKSDYFGTYASAFDVVFDVVGGDTLQRSWSLLRSNGRMVTVAAESEQPADDRVKGAFFIVEPNRQQLTEVADMVDSGRLEVFVDTIVPLAEASDAYTGRLAGRRGRGKVVVAVAE